MKRLSVFSALFLILVMTSGCVIEQQQPLGTNNNRDEGFSGYGTNEARELEGPLSDMMVPDWAPKGRTDRAGQIARNNEYVPKERNLGFEEQGTNRVGPRIFSNRPGTLRDKYMLSNKPHLEKQYEPNVEGLSNEDAIESIVLSFKEVENVHVVTHDGQTLVGVQSSEQNRRKLRRDIKEELKKENIDHVHIATDRRTVSRIQALERGMSTAEPFEEIGAMFAEIMDTITEE
ncbi:YhcN/YlaJ family sporulation lipoprotein [Alkalihalobacillus sp. LMS39]|uniref:YhcN/YlaJ family sporulation lipoprotein n=1 Tax=Alkalihalobacillus sp. LMS39 TaxID=2924032 RepID=UPI001FB4C721|nr:YhcN/YlaJ family sporulation lipoprotein [Alkalihalobacillus sp. LMS39]UOE92229.1 YhcN/YlaJ family sporulation lipoprotein [Alkalihalobacillus sp. LMS39]